MYDVDGDELDGDVMGDVMGDIDGDDIVGVVRRNRRTGRKQIVQVPKRSLALPPKPNWRGNQVAPGVNAPAEGMVPLPMAPQAGNGCSLRRSTKSRSKASFKSRFAPSVFWCRQSARVLVPWDDCWRSCTSERTCSKPKSPDGLLSYSVRQRPLGLA